MNGDTPKTDSFKLSAKSSLEVISDNSWAKRLLASHCALERDNQQLRNDLKQCAEVLHKLKCHDLRNSHVATNCFVCEYVDSALSLPSVQAALKDGKQQNKLTS